MVFRQTHLKAVHDNKFLCSGGLAVFSEEKVCLLFTREGVSQICEQIKRLTNSAALSPGQILAISVSD